MQKRLLRNCVGLRIKLSRSKSAFCVHSDKDFQVKITKATLHIREVDVAPTILNKHNGRLNKGERAKYPLRRSDNRRFNVPQGNLSFGNASIVTGQIPRRIVISSVTSKAFQGDVTLNPFNFKQFNLHYLVLNVDGEQFPSKRLTPDFANKYYLNCYYTLLTATGIGGDNRSLEITPEKYPNEYDFYLNNLSPSEHDSCQRLDWNS